MCGNHILSEFHGVVLLVHFSHFRLELALLKKDSLLPEHMHINEQTGYLVKGSIKLFIDGKSQVLHPGDSWSILSNIKHRAEILEDSVAIEVFSPSREDYLKYKNEEDIIE